MPVPLLLLGLTAWQTTAAVTAIALSGYGLKWLSNRAQAHRIYNAYMSGGKPALRRAIYEEGLAESKEHCEVLIEEYIQAMSHNDPY